MAFDGLVTGPTPLTIGIEAFRWAVGQRDSSAIESANIRAARDAGYTGNRETLIAIGEGIRNASVFAAGQGGGPGPDRAGPARAVAGTPPMIPVPGLPPIPGSRPPLPVPGGTPGLPGGPSIPDRIPGRVGVGSAGVAGILSRVVGWGFGLLTYPRSTASDDVVCIKTKYGPWCPPGMPAVPAPSAIPGQRPGSRRRPRAVPGSPPRRRERGRVAAPPVAPPRPRGRPVTVSQPAAIPQPRVVDRSFPVPQSLPPPVYNPSPVTVPAPRAIPAPVPRVSPLAAVAAVAVPGLLSWVGSRVGSQTSIPGVGTVPGSIPGAVPGVGAVQLPGGAANPLAELATQPLPLTSFNAAVAQSPAQELDRQCRERAKQKRKKRKRKERSVCYRGTFYELKNGTRKQRKEKIPCR